MLESLCFPPTELNLGAGQILNIWTVRVKFSKKEALVWEEGSHESVVRPGFSWSEVGGHSSRRWMYSNEMSGVLGEMFLSRAVCERPV